MVSNGKQRHGVDRPCTVRACASGSSWRYLPIILVLTVGGLAFALGLHQHLSFEALKVHRGDLMAWISPHPVLAAVAFVAFYALAIVFMPPSGTVMTVIGGFLFGAVTGTVLVVLAATVGATLLFLVTRYSLATPLRSRIGGTLASMEAGFRSNALSYMLVLRLIPLFPFWLVNVAPAFLGVSLRVFIIGTFIGIIPGTAVFAVFGAGLGRILDRGETISLEGVLTPEIVAALIGLAVLSLAPVAYRRWRQRRTAGRPPAPPG